MTHKSDSQVEEWLKKLERESWQLELLVSAFTIFLLIGATSAFSDFLTDLRYQFNFSQGAPIILMLFLILLSQSLKALTVFLIAHLLLRGFWIGTIGLRSVQNKVDFEALNYSPLFTDRLRKKVISLDRLVIRLDEICSVIFSFAFLVIFSIIAFGLYLAVVGMFGFVLSTILNLIPGNPVFVSIIGAFLLLIFITTGLIYLLDFFTLGFFKKFKWFSRIYYPFYWFYSYVTLAFMSRSIYYYMVSKFSKKNIRIVFSFGGLFILAVMLFQYDHFPYFPEPENELTMRANYYEDERPENDHISKVSISSKFINGAYMDLFIRYDPEDNANIQALCPDFQPPKEEGLNPNFSLETTKGNLHIREADFETDDLETMLSCLSRIYRISINDSVCEDLKYRFFVHPAKQQKGIVTVLSTSNFLTGENVIKIEKINPKDSLVLEAYAYIPFWYAEK